MGKVLELKSSKPPKVTRDTVQLWRFSQQIDSLIQEAVVETHLSGDEVAAVLAHRLGTLIATSDNSEVLREFCERVVGRQSAS